MRWSNIAGRATMILVTALCTGAMTTLSAQEPTIPAAQTSPVLSGPRLAPEWSRFEPSATESNATNSAALAAAGGRNHTFVFSTLALVIIGVLVVVLVF